MHRFHAIELVAMTFGAVLATVTIAGAFAVAFVLVAGTFAEIIKW
jgi:hypothetical protein